MILTKLLSIFTGHLPDREAHNNTVASLEVLKGQRIEREERIAEIRLKAGKIDDLAARAIASIKRNH